jgi:hypothetical protein
MGDADRGFGQKQPGSWAYSCLPFLEEHAVHQIGAGIANFNDKKAALSILSSTPVAGFYCPTRRPPVATPRIHTGNQGINANHVEAQARSDYAANLGPRPPGEPAATQWNDGGPSSFTRADQGVGFFKDKSYTDPVSGETKNWLNKIHGVVFQAVEYKFKDITDGTSKTYMIGEKYLMPECYSLAPGERPGLRNWADDQSAWAGDDLDTCRNADAESLPLQDQSGFEDWYRFGSAHPGVFQMSMCDASVRSVSYDIDARTHELLGNRRDGEALPDF